jgi:uncharacterized membrane protein YeaQ/YmgE (transglycosylase-associated protein family)
MAPDLLLIILIGTAYGAAFHLWQARRVRDILVYVPASILGFALGNVLGALAGLHLVQIGQIHLIPASLGSCFLLFIARWLKL